MPYSLEKWLAGRWIAGPKMDDAIALAKRMNKRGVSAMINYLGEDFTRKADVQEAVDAYLALITKMAENRVSGELSIKPTQIGLRVSYGLMKKNYIRIIERARMNGIFVWLDMEEPGYVPATIRAYLEVDKHVRGGICIQAYLKRSLGDAERITRHGGVIRLVKGAYGHGEGGMMRGEREVRSNYIRIMRYLFGHADHFMIATHDTDIIEEARALERKSKRRASYAMLNGINNVYARKLAKAGESVSLYLPFGSRWIDYSYRRMKEVSHLGLIMGSLFRGQQL